MTLKELQAIEESMMLVNDDFIRHVKVNTRRINEALAQNRELIEALEGLMVKGHTSDCYQWRRTGFADSDTCLSSCVKARKALRK